MALMPVPRAITRSNRRFLNPLVLRLSSYLPPFATVHHQGRRSGREYATPVWAFRSREASPREVRVVVALTYGPDVDWVRNVERAGAFTVTRGGREYVVDDLRRLRGDDGLGCVPALIRPPLRVLRVDEYLDGRVRPTV
jgi:deazaflavin-dependent oxidoreductase (nitroreductase family)